MLVTDHALHMPFDAIARTVEEHVDELVAFRPETGVMLVSNHRSFFDQYAMLLACYMGPVPWAKRLYFPVRSNFFYDQPLGDVGRRADLATP